VVIRYVHISGLGGYKLQKTKGEPMPPVYLDGCTEWSGNEIDAARMSKWGHGWVEIEKMVLSECSKRGIKPEVRGYIAFKNERTNLLTSV
jgi:hypothetical protein